MDRETQEEPSVSVWLNVKPLAYQRTTKASWHKRMLGFMRFRDAVHMQIPAGPPPLRQAGIRITFHDFNVQADPDNCAKAVMDSISGRLIVDDSWKWVHTLTLRGSRRAGGGITLEIWYSDKEESLYRTTKSEMNAARRRCAAKARKLLPGGSDRMRREFAERLFEGEMVRIDAEHAARAAEKDGLTRKRIREVRRAES